MSRRKHTSSGSSWRLWCRWRRTQHHSSRKAACHRPNGNRHQWVCRPPAVWHSLRIFRMKCLKYMHMYAENLLSQDKKSGCLKSGCQKISLLKLSMTLKLDSFCFSSCYGERVERETSYLRRKRGQKKSGCEAREKRRRRKWSTSGVHRAFLIAVVFRYPLSIVDCAGGLTRLQSGWIRSASPTAVKYYG